LRSRGLTFLILFGLLASLALVRSAAATEPAPGCLGLGVGLLNSYFDVPWSAFWGIEKQNSAAEVQTILSPEGGLSVIGQGGAFAIYQPLEAPKLVPGYDYLLMDVLARVFVKQGSVGISLSAGPASFAAQAYPRPPFRSGSTGEWNTIGLQIMVSANSPVFDRVSIVSLSANAEFSLGCITFVTHERNIGLPDPGPPTKGAMLRLPDLPTPAAYSSGFAVVQQQ
jgi:hypothetical protein